jgi:acyl dehydratase
MARVALTNAFYETASGKWQMNALEVMMSAPRSYKSEDIWNALGTEPIVSDWLDVEQETIDQFADATRDWNWLHIDPERATQEGPADGTIAHGFWTISMLSHFMRSTPAWQYPDGVQYVLNYGLDRVRLMTPVPVGGRIRDRMQVVKVRRAGENRFVIKTQHTIEVEGGNKPAMVAESLGMIVYPSGEEVSD